ncbi:hypothetical protein LTS17_002974 [Exophiala oligosperma]
MSFPSLPSSPPPSTTNTLRDQLLDLDREGQALKLKQSKLERRLRAVRKLIAKNINDTRVKMKEFDANLASQQAVKPFEAFFEDLDNVEAIVEGLWHQLQGNAALRIAVHAIANGRGSADHMVRVAAALMTELVGDATQVIQDIAARAQQRVNRNGEDDNVDDDNDDNLDPQLVDATSTSDDNPAFLHERVIREPSLPNAMSSSHHQHRLTSPSIKSEDVSDHQPTPSRATPNMYASQSNNSSSSRPPPATQYSSANIFAQPPSVATGAMYAPAPGSAATAATASAPANMPTATLSSSGNILNRTPKPPTTTAVQTPPTQATTVAARPVQVPGASSRFLRLESAFPGLLDSINSRPTPAKKRPAPPSEPTPPPPERPATPARAIKRNKTAKEQIMQPAFVEFLTKVQQLHQAGKTISRTLQCSKCQNVRRDVRVLSCLHLYCHKCIIALRNEASAGDALTGFKASCAVGDCKGSVSGKTSVIDGEIIDFLNWYDTQDAAIGDFPCQIQVMKLAFDKTPDDDDVRVKKQAVEKEVGDAQMNGETDTPVDLVKLVRLIRKPF